MVNKLDHTKYETETTFTKLPKWFQLTKRLLNYQYKIFVLSCDPFDIGIWNEFAVACNAVCAVRLCACYILSDERREEKKKTSRKWIAKTIHSRPTNEETRNFYIFGSSSNYENHDANCRLFQLAFKAVSHTTTFFPPIICLLVRLRFHFRRN